MPEGRSQGLREPSERLALSLQQEVKRVRKQCGLPLGLGSLLSPTGEGSPGQPRGRSNSVALSLRGRLSSVALFSGRQSR